MLAADLWVAVRETYGRTVDEGVFRKSIPGDRIHSE